MAEEAPVVSSRTHCVSCGTPWADHLGIAGTCSKLQQAQKTIDALKQELGAAIDRAQILIIERDAARSVSKSLSTLS